MLDKNFKVSNEFLCKKSQKAEIKPEKSDKQHRTAAWLSKKLDFISKCA